MIDSKGCTIALAMCIACASQRAASPAPKSNVAKSCEKIDQANAEPAYVPRTASSLTVALPELPPLRERRERIGEDFTVWGASYAIRNRFQRPTVEGRSIQITGYIVKTNLRDAPRCTVHAAGVADPTDCRAPVPAFWIGDKANAPEADAIKVMGWVSSYAQLYEAIRAYARANAKPYIDAYWRIGVPNPIPARGAKVRVRGVYARVWHGGAAGAEVDPIMGLLAYQDMVVLEAAPARAKLPGMRP